MKANARRWTRSRRDSRSEAPSNGLDPLTALLHRCEQLVARLLAAAAGFGADPAVLVVHVAAQSTQSPMQRRSASRSILVGCGCVAMTSRTLTSTPSSRLQRSPYGLE